MCLFTLHSSVACAAAVPGFPACRRPARQPGSKSSSAWALAGPSSPRCAFWLRECSETPPSCPSPAASVCGGASRSLPPGSGPGLRIVPAIGPSRPVTAVVVTGRGARRASHGSPVRMFRLRSRAGAAPTTTRASVRWWCWRCARCKRQVAWTMAASWRMRRSPLTGRLRCLGCRRPGARGRRPVRWSGSK